MTGADPQHVSDQTDEATRRADAVAAQVPHEADRPPTDAEEAMADEVAADVSDEAGEHFQEMAELGADVKGEGQID